jgi:hypothetical protein
MKCGHREEKLCLTDSDHLFSCDDVYKIGVYGLSVWAIFLPHAVNYSFLTTYGRIATWIFV